MIFMKHARLLSTTILCCLLASPLTPAIAYSFSTGVFDFQQKLAKKGNPVAQYKLAYMYENGLGTKKNLGEALAWYKKAAAQRYPAAQMRITYIETKKNGYNQKKHSVWLSRLEQNAAENDGESLFLLGTMHKDGYIVKKDLKKAADLLKRASKKGVTSAETELESVQAILFSQQDKQQQIKSQKDTQQQIANRKKAEKKRQDKLAAQKAKRDRNNAEKKRREKEIARQKKEKARQEEGRRIAMEKQAKTEEAKKAKEAEEARKAKEAEEAEKPLVDKNMCKGKKARFLTTCR